jgi:hypothetical protein
VRQKNTLRAAPSGRTVDARQSVRQGFSPLPGNLFLAGAMNEEFDKQFLSAPCIPPI